MNIATLTLGDYQVNCYIVWAEGSKTCAVIDPGYEPETVLAKAAALGLSIEAILLTHGHFDHVGAVEAIVRATGCALWMKEADFSHFPDSVLNRLFPLAGRELDAFFFAHNDVIPAGGLRFTVYCTAGHTHGSVCFACEDALFTGDTLFAGSCGRTDLPGGDPGAMRRSLEFLRELDFHGRVFPGHGAATTLDAERRQNPYMA